MRKYLIETLKCICLWFLYNVCKEEPITIPTQILDADLINFAKRLCDRQEKISIDTAGEWKRDRVFEQMINTFPYIKPKYIYLAILLARMV